jgi:hypothetical protein
MKPNIYFLMYDECIVHGGFFDNFEYYYLVKLLFRDCKVKWRCITNHSKNEVIALIEDKYENIKPEVYKDIEVIKHKSKVFYRDPLMIDVLICATNSAMYWFLEHGNIQAAKTYIGLGDWKDIHPKQNKYYKNHLILCDERIYHYGDSCNWLPYRKKILFDMFKQKDYPVGKYDYMLNLSLIERRFPKDWMMELFEFYGYHHVSFAAYTGHKNEKYYSYFNDLDMVHLIIPPVEEFMGLFNIFIYTPYKDGTDATPRLIPECIYYEKDIEYYDKGLNKLQSGGYWRFKDTMEDVWLKLWLKEDDEIIGHIDRCLSL